MQNDTSTRKNPSLFWKTIKQGYAKPCKDNDISEIEWFNYFKTLLYNDSNSNIETSDFMHNGLLNDNDTLNCPISTDEIYAGIRYLKAGKSEGPYGIGADFFLTN